MTITDLLRDLGIRSIREGHNHCRPGWVQIDCPQCSPSSNHFRLGINVHYLYASCWACGRVSLPACLAEASDMPLNRIRSLLAGVDKVGRGDTGVRHQGTLKMPLGVSPMLPQHKRYLRDRGIDPDEAESLWGVKGIGIAPTMSWRLWIPIHHKGALSSWTTRSIGRGKRYINAPSDMEAFPAKRTLSGSHLASHVIMVTESPMSRLLLGRGCVDTGGVGITEAQIKQMAKFPVRYICLDADAVGQRKAEELCQTLKVMPGKTINIVLESGKDPGECSKTEQEQLKRLLR